MILYIIIRDPMLKKVPSKASECDLKTDFWIKKEYSEAEYLESGYE